MISIRLSRIGKKHSPSYKITVKNGRSKRNGKSIETLGFWKPKGELSFNKAQYEKWIAQGAIPSKAVRTLLENSSNQLLLEK